MYAMRHLVQFVTATVAGTLTMLVIGASAAWAGPAPLDQPGGAAPSSTTRSPAGDQFWTATSIGLTAAATIAVIAVVSVLMVTSVRHHHHRGAPAPV